jgi:hypothetical protein
MTSTFRFWLLIALIALGAAAIALGGRPFS